MKKKLTFTIALPLTPDQNVSANRTILPALIWAILLCFSNASYGQNVRYDATALPNNNGNSNSAFGHQAMFLNSNTGSYNTAIGFRSLYNNTNGWSNTSSGYQSMFNNKTGGYNAASGAYSLWSNSTASQNTAHGYASLYKNTTGANNVAIGYWALYNNTTANFNIAMGSYALEANTTGYNNIAIGYQSLNRNSTGYWNTAQGHQALYANTIGTSNTVHGYQSMYLNTTGSFNTAAGFKTLHVNTTGQYNTAIGYAALSSNTTASFNTALGRSALVYNTTGAYNAATGNAALAYNTSGRQNTANGYAALYTNTTGYANTALGYYADVATTNLHNATAIGYTAIATASNQIMLGNTSVVSIMGAGNFVIMSDGRFKKNLKENVPGLEFIKQLRPLTYTYDVHELNNHLSGNRPVGDKAEAQLQDEEAIKVKEQKVYTGFVAQEVETTAKKFGYDFSGIYKPSNDKDVYGISYSDFVIPLVKSVQELAKINEEKDLRINGLQKQIDDLKAAIKSGLPLGSSLKDAIIEQNSPNPFKTTTTISYTLPATYATAHILITDQNGKTLKQLNVSGNGRGKVNIDAATLSSGTYNYSLTIDGRPVTSRQMVLIK